MAPAPAPPGWARLARCLQNQLALAGMSSEFTHSQFTHPRFPPPSPVWRRTGIPLSRQDQHPTCIAQPEFCDEISAESCLLSAARKMPVIQSTLTHDDLARLNKVSSSKVMTKVDDSISRSFCDEPGLLLKPVCL